MFVSSQSSPRTLVGRIVSWFVLLAVAAPVGAIQTGSSPNDNRLARVAALEEAGDRTSLEALERLALEDPSSPVRRAAAEALARVPLAADAAARIVRAAFEVSTPPAARPDPEVTAALLPGYGTWLADQSAPGRGDHIPIALGLRHTAGGVRRSASEAFEGAITRMLESPSPGRARAFLDRLSALGLERDLALYQRARIALRGEGDAADALAAAEEIVRSRGASMRPIARIDAYESQLWLFRGLYLVGAAQFALGRAEVAAEAVDRAAAALDVALAERRDLLGDAERLRHADLLRQKALAEVMRTLLAIANDEPSVQRLRRARAAHVAALEAQAVLAERDGNVLSGWDALLLSDLSPYALLFGDKGFAASGADAIDAARLVELQGELGASLAAISPGELPGFAAIEIDASSGWDEAARRRLFEPLQDDVRLALFERIRRARVDGIDAEIEDASDALDRARDRSFGLLPEDEVQALERLQRLRFFALQDLQDQGGADPNEWARDLRVPGTAALWHAQDLVSQGQSAEGRAIAGALEADIDRRGISRYWYVLGHDRVIRARLLAGSALTDEGKGEEAEAMLLGAVERIDDLVRELRDNGATDEDLAGLLDTKATALVSLAVNANVRLGDPVKATKHYEAAYELRQDEFMRALLACYRARSGDESAARTLLDAIRPGPGTWYNLACAHALLGDTERALDLLEIELELNHGTEASRDRQRAWAAADPDLANLRGNPRFQRLVRSR